ncbi:hypothetical protein HELRODRAFT_176853 [Helobdella robusta]|uniref:Protein quiver n=1 Tax=Helobdella robusta TaxID=6412 RepID=T1FAZ1_HELRO|nr:hypothetical protein HELRODRAFT_176853 [Helobdella robusta]ESN98393.1 hypothetical protein HELRODRAFT_176853 [Helobdella robusta]
MYFTNAVVVATLLLLSTTPQRQVSAEVECYSCNGKEECEQSFDKMDKCKAPSSCIIDALTDKQYVFRRMCSHGDVEADQCTEDLGRIQYCACRGNLCNKYTYDELSKIFEDNGINYDEYDEVIE